MRRTQIFLSTPFRTQCPKFLHLPTSQKWFMAARAGTVPTLTHSVIAPRHRPVLPIVDGKGRPWLRGKPSNPCHMRHCPHLRGLRRNIPLCLSVCPSTCLSTRLWTASLQTSQLSSLDIIVHNATCCNIFHIRQQFVYFNSEDAE